jgi:hypothetical protein
MRGNEQLIDPDEPGSWPETTRRWVSEQANRLVGTTEYSEDLAISPAQDNIFRQTFGHRHLVAYHCTCLLPTDVASMRLDGLRVLNEKLITDRIRAAAEQGALAAHALRRAETGNVFNIGGTQGRVGKICFVIGRSIFDDDPGGCEPLLRYWGGEAIRGGPDEVADLANVGKPSIVVVGLDLSPPHDDPSWPSLAKVFVGSELGLARQFSEVHVHRPVLANDIQAIWQPSSEDYDRHSALPH